jgi:hypothetical protein
MRKIDSSSSASIKTPHQTPLHNLYLPLAAGAPLPVDPMGVRDPDPAGVELPVDPAPDPALGFSLGGWYWNNTRKSKLYSPHVFFNEA